MELWDGYWKDGALANVDLVRGEPIPEGIYHLVSEVLVRHVDGDYLIVQRDLRKPNYGGYYETTAGGSALKGEDKLTCAKRELLEETGIEALSYEELGRYVSHDTIYFSFLCITDCEKTSVRLQEGETISYKWLKKEEFISFINSDAAIPSQKMRYESYFRKIQSGEADMNFVTKEAILKGWSGDKKYCVTDKTGTRYLLRVSDIAQYEKEREKFDMMKQVASLGVPMCRPIEFFTSEEGACALYDWIDGKDAEEIIPALPEAEQYAYGMEAGRILKTIHTIPAPPTQEAWESRFNRKMDFKIKKYGECPIKYENGEAFIAYIHANRHLLKDRPQTYHHGDYHIGNLMLDREGKLQVIDFNRCDYGDPWEEFNRIVWCAEAAPHFATGMVDGYFDGDVPQEFWRLLALYISGNTLSSVYWAIPFGQGEVETMLKQGKNVLKWYDNMKNPVPAWYGKSGGTR